MSTRYCNSMIPSDAEFDRAMACHCDRCECDIDRNGLIERNGDMYCEDCAELLDEMEGEEE